MPLKAVLNVRQELLRAFGNLPDPFPVYRGILPDPNRDVGKHGAAASARSDAGDPGRHWTLDFEVAQAFANSTHEAQLAYYEDEDLARLGPGRILHGHVALRDVDWRETFDRFCRFSLGDEWGHQGDATRAERHVPCHPAARHEGADGGADRRGSGWRSIALGAAASCDETEVTCHEAVHRYTRR